MEKKNKIGEFGVQYTQFKHKPKQAIKWLKKVKRGECIAALHRSDIGDIDIVYGEVTDPIKHKGFGLAHIIDKHGEAIKKLGFEVEDFIPIVIQFGVENERKRERDKIVYEQRSFRFVIKKKANKKWLLTAFDLKRGR